MNDINDFISSIDAIWVNQVIKVIKLLTKCVSMYLLNKPLNPWFISLDYARSGI